MPPVTASRSTSSSSTETGVDAVGDAPVLLEVGRIAKAHGLDGEVNVVLVTNRSERLDPGSVLSSDVGDLVVERSRPHGDRWLVRFVGCTDRSAAEGLRGIELRGEPIDDPEELWVHDLIGARVISGDGVDRGVVVAVQDNPAADLLVLDSGALVPVVFVVGGPADGVVRVEVPDGLFELGS